MKSNCAVIGDGAWGTALSITLAHKGEKVNLWVRTEKEAEEIERTRENARFLPHFLLPSRVQVTHSLSEALDEVEIVIFAVPAQKLRQNVKLTKGYISHHPFIVSVIKGLELPRARRMSEILLEELGTDFEDNISVLSGPTIASEVASGCPSVTMAASRNQATASEVARRLSSPQLFVFPCSDVVGVELGGIIKHAVAIACGISDGFSLGNSTKVALITLGLQEMEKLGERMGADRQTFWGFSALGDMITTCFSNLSRNRYVGVELARGKSIRSIRRSIPHTAEGITAIIGAQKLACELQVDLPLTSQIGEVLRGKLPVRHALPSFFVFPPDDGWAKAGKIVEPAITIACGISDGLGWGSNTKAALITLGLQDMARLGEKMGVDHKTFFGFSALSEVIIDCFSNLSHNRYVGVELAQGKSIEHIQEFLPHITQEIAAITSAQRLAHTLKVDLPLTSQMLKVLEGKLSLHDAILDLLRKGPNLSPHSAPYPAMQCKS
jgi:glycerol-3-phosphate dehydrogenase (NAD(P)+)